MVNASYIISLGVVWTFGFQVEHCATSGTRLYSDRQTVQQYKIVQDSTSISVTMASRILSRTGPLALARCWPEPGSPRPLWTFGALRALNCKPGPKAVLAPLDLTDGQLMKLNISHSTFESLSQLFIQFPTAGSANSASTGSYGLSS